MKDKPDWFVGELSKQNLTYKAWNPWQSNQNTGFPKVKDICGISDQLTD